MKSKIHLGARTFASPSEIIHLEAKENYTLIHFADDSKLLSSITIGTIEKRLIPYGFFRINRSTVINLKHINRFRVISNPSQVDSKNNSKPAIIVSRRRVAAFQACLKA